MRLLHRKEQRMLEPGEKTNLLYNGKKLDELCSHPRSLLTKERVKRIFDGLLSNKVFMVQGLSLCCSRIANCDAGIT